MSRNRIEFLEPNELLAVLKIARQRSARDWAALLLTYSHGLRASETCGLKLSDLKSGILSVQRLKGSAYTSQQLMPHKGNPLLDETRAVREYLRVRPKDSGDALFISQKGGHLHRSQLFRIYRDIAAAAGLPANKRHVHVLKHSLCSHLVQGGANLARIQKYAGHSSISSTVRYITVTDSEAAREAHNALMSIF